MIECIIEFIIAFVVYLIIIGSLFRTEDIDHFDDITFIVLIFAGICIASFGFDAILYLVIFRLSIIIINILISLLISAIKIFKKTIDKDK